MLIIVHAKADLVTQPGLGTDVDKGRKNQVETVLFPPKKRRSRKRRKKDKWPSP